jgi:ubiquinone biosynthesis protein UbiJ
LAGRFADAIGMNSVDQLLAQAIAKLQMAIPNPNQWAGAAAQSCAESIERLVHEVEFLRQRLASWSL